VIKAVIAFTGGMTVEAGLTLVNISSDLIVLIVHVGLVVVMAADTGEFSIIAGIGMAFGATVPGAIVGTGVYREILGVVVRVFCRLPARIGGVAKLAVGRNGNVDMVRAGGGNVIRLVAVKALAGNIRIVSTGMTGLAIGYVMPSGQWEEIMVDARTGPGECIHAVTVSTICGIVRFNMIWTRGRRVICFVAIITFDTQRFEFQEGGGWVAILAVSSVVRPQ